MALTYSEMVPLGKSAPDFKLKGIDGKSYSLREFSGKKALVVMFICRHCPYVVAVQGRISALASELGSRGVQFVAINSNDWDRYPDVSPAHMAIQAKEQGFTFPYLIDEDQTVAKAYGAVCTPDFFVFDEYVRLRYRGRLDDSWKDEKQVKTEDLRLAIEAILQGQLVSNNQLPSMGCSIKWRPGV
jgi:peroxiredoxin